MNSKFLKTYILAIILFVAIGFLVFLKHIKNGIRQIEPRQVFNFEKSVVNKIDLEYSDPTSRDSSERKIVQLQKIDGVWIVATNHNYQAREKDIATLLEKVGEIKQGELVSNNPERQDELEIGERSGAHIKLWQNENLLADFWLGKSGAGGDSTYFRAEGSDLVYSSYGNIRFYFQKRDWIDRTVLKLDKDKINKISLKIKWPYVVLKKAEEKLDTEKLETGGDEAKKESEKKVKWNVIEPREFEADESKIDNLLNVVSGLSAQEVIFDKTIDETGLTNPKSKIIIETTDSEASYEILIGDKIDASKRGSEDAAPGEQRDLYYVKTADSDQIFAIGARIIENTFSQKADDFRILE